MSLKGIRFCHVAPAEDARALAAWLGKEGWGLDERDMGGDADNWCGAVFPTTGGPGESWTEIWQEAEGMPAGTMLHIVVDDADAHAQTARGNGIEVQGPIDAHGERIYFAKAPGGLSVAVLSKVAEA